MNYYITEKWQIKDRLDGSYQQLYLDRMIKYLRDVYGKDFPITNAIIGVMDHYITTMVDNYKSILGPNPLAFRYYLYQDNLQLAAFDKPSTNLTHSWIENVGNKEVKPFKPSLDPIDAELKLIVLGYLDYSIHPQRSYKDDMIIK